MIYTYSGFYRQVGSLYIFIQNLSGESFKQVTMELTSLEETLLLGPTRHQVYE